MTLDLREVARRQNNADHAAGRLPSRYVEDVGVLHAVAGILLGTPGHEERRSVAAPPAPTSPRNERPDHVGPDGHPVAALGIEAQVAPVTADRIRKDASSPAAGGGAVAAPG